MSERFFCDAEGNYLGAFDGAEPPEGSVEVPSCPNAAKQVWLSDAWTDAVLTVDEQLTAIETTFEKRKAALSAQLATILLFDGPSEATSTTALQTEYTQAVNDRAAAIEALLFGEM